MIRSEMATTLAQKIPQLSVQDAEVSVDTILAAMTGERVYVLGKRKAHFKPWKDLRDCANMSQVTS